MERKPFPEPFVAELEDGVHVEFSQYSHPEGVNPSSFMIKVRGPGQAGQEEFVGRIRVEVCAHGNREQFRRFLILTAEHAGPIESGKGRDSFKVGGPSFHPEDVSYKITMSVPGPESVIRMPVSGLHKVRMEMLQTKPPGEMY